MSRLPQRAPGHFVRLCGCICALTLLSCADEFQRTEPEQLPEPATTYDVSAEAPPVVPACGNGEDDPGEECDDGNGINTDGCTNTCQRTPAPLCVPCSSDGDCGRDEDLCLDRGDDSFCARDCADVPCPRGYECRDVLENEVVIAQQCVPSDDTCPECPDDDGDGVCNGDDICPFGDDATDEDADGNPDACELCPGEDDTVDSDRDGIPDGCDCGGLGADCSVNAFCFVGDGDPTCECRPGFTGDGISCRDINECAEGTDNCAEQADCVNTLGGFMCVCPEGFIGDGLTCTDIDECATETDDCVDPAVCTNTEGGFTCACGAGYTDTTGDATACVDIDECARAQDDCDPQAACANTPGSFTCTCNAGYTGDGTTCTDVDECAAETDDCGDNAMCFNTVGGFECLCNPGYEGDGRTCAPTYRVVVFPDIPDYTIGVSQAVPLALADPDGMETALGLGLDPFYTNTSTELSVALRQGAALAVVDTPDPLPNGVPIALLDWVDRGGKLIFGTNRFDVQAGLARALGVDVGDELPETNAQAVSGAPVNLALGIGPSFVLDDIRHLTPISEDDDVLVELNDEEAGDPSVVTLTRGGRVIINGRATWEAAEPALALMLRNEIAYLLKPDDYPLFNSTFDHNIRGWISLDSDAKPQWASADAEGSESSGSLRLQTVDDATQIGAFQCAPAEPGQILRLRMSYQVSDAADATADLAVAFTAIEGTCATLDANMGGDASLIDVAQTEWSAFEGDAAPLQLAVPDGSFAVGVFVFVDPPATGTVDAFFDDITIEPVPGCADGTVEEVFPFNMIGCGGSVVFAEAASLCGEGWEPCTASRWVSNLGRIVNDLGLSAPVPTYNYWSADLLGWTQGDAPECSVSVESGTYCGNGTAEDPLASAAICVGSDAADPAGNVCEAAAKYNCGLDDVTGAQSFSFCMTPGASALCCRPPNDLGCSSAEAIGDWRSVLLMLAALLIGWIRPRRPSGTGPAPRH